MSPWYGLSCIQDLYHGPMLYAQSSLQAEARLRQVGREIRSDTDQRSLQNGDCLQCER